MYQLTVVKYNIPFKALPMLVCMKHSTWGCLVVNTALGFALTTRHSPHAVFFIHTCGSALTSIYRTLHGQDQREKCALYAIKHTFQANSALLTTKSALTVQ